MPKPVERTGPRLAYRPGLDGLRAIAVAGVFLYHSRIDWLPGGFLGVDLFFVLSGYLITSLLLVEWEARNRIDLRRFWLRRARRLLPALVVVVLASLALAAIFARQDLAHTRSDAVSSLLYYTNWHEIIANHSYFNLMGNPSLLQHTWSLAIEQEFNPTLYRGGDLAAAFCFVVLLAAVAHPRTGIGEALGVAPLRWVGERSYGIYLWHWPIIVLVAGVNARPSVGIVVGEAALVLAVGALASKFGRQPT